MATDWRWVRQFQPYAHLILEPTLRNWGHLGASIAGLPDRHAGHRRVTKFGHFLGLDSYPTNEQVALRSVGLDEVVVVVDRGA